MSKGNRRKFYSMMDSKFAADDLPDSRRAIAGTVIPALGMPRCYEILEVADTFGIWLELSYSSILEAQKISPDPTVTLSNPIKNEITVFEKICAKYGIAKEEHQLRAKAALMIRKAGTKACSQSLSEFESFELWLLKCRDLSIRKKPKKKSRRRKSSRRKKSNLTKLPPLNQMRHPNTEVVGDRKIEFARNWQRKNAKHQLADEDEKILRRNLPKV